MSELIITEKTNITAIADAVRNKTGSSSGLTLNGIIEGINSISGGTTINLDKEITTQENTIASQDTLIANIVSALEGKSASGAPLETVTGTIDFYDPWNPHVFCYEGENGEIQIFTTSVGDSLRTFIIRKNSIVVFHCPTIADRTSAVNIGLELDVLSAASGLTVLQASTYNNSIVTAICKVTDNFNISWADEDDLGP